MHVQAPATLRRETRQREWGGKGAGGWERPTPLGLVQAGERFRSGYIPNRRTIPGSGYNKLHFFFTKSWKFLDNCKWHQYFKSVTFFIRPSSDGTYYGMVMSVRPGLRPSVRHSFPHFSPIVLNLGSEKGTHFLGQKGHFLSRNLILRAHYFAAPQHYAAH